VTTIPRDPIRHIAGDETASDRETAAAIRKRIAEEVEQHIDEIRGRHVDPGDYTMGIMVGLKVAQGIIERGTGVVAEGEQG